MADLLADYLARSPGVTVPGGDGLRVDIVPAGYNEWAARGAVPAEAERCRRHPDG